MHFFFRISKCQTVFRFFFPFNFFGCSNNSSSSVHPCVCTGHSQIGCFIYNQMQKFLVNQILWASEIKYTIRAAPNEPQAVGWIYFIIIVIIIITIYYMYYFVRIISFFCHTTRPTWFINVIAKKPHTIHSISK